MALISCPECGKQISETTPSCPHCGYLFSSVTEPAAPGLTPTKIGETKTNTGTGIIYIVMGLAAVLFGIPFIPLFGLGIFSIIGGVAFIGLGARKVSGEQETYCPHCGKLMYIGKNEIGIKCSTCKKQSVRDGEYLKPIQ